MDVNRLPTLRTRLATVLIVLAALFAAVVSYVLYVNFQAELRSSLRHRLETIATLAGLQQNGDTFLLVQEAHDQYFEEINTQNVQIKQSDPDLIYVYTMRKDERGIYFVVDAGLPGDEGIAAFGDVYLEPGPTLVENFDTLDQTILEPEIYTDEFGSFLSGYTPIYTSDGRKVGVLGVDISANTIVTQERAFLLRLVAIYLSTLPLLFVGGIVSANYLARPIIRLRDAANRISKGELSHRITEIPETRELAELAIDFNAMSISLNELITDLEHRVAERTEDLTRKTDQLRAASYIARQTAEVQDLRQLLDTVVHLVTDQFGYYHTGIFLVNEAGDLVTLVSASSEGGKRMVDKGHSLRVGTQGIVGFVAAQKKPRIALDVGTDAVFFNNPDLPLTRSEIALPLLVRERLLGVLDIQSDKPGAFTVQDIDVLATLADQLSVAIEKAQLLDASQAAFAQLEALTAVRTREAWIQKLKERERVVSYTPLGLRAEKMPGAEPNALTVPISLRGQHIGTISIARKGNAAWSKQDEEMIREVAIQTGLAVDNIRLLEEATQRAKQEQTVGELAFRFSQALDMDSLLQTAARELGQLPGIDETSIYLGQPEGSEEQTPANGRNKTTRRNGS